MDKLVTRHREGNEDGDRKIEGLIQSDRSSILLRSLLGCFPVSRRTFW